MTLTRSQIVRQLRTLSKNEWLLAGELDSFEGFHVSEYDLDQMNRKQLKSLLKQVKYQVTDKGIWFQA
jgi:hypothetical protein